MSFEYLICIKFQTTCWDAYRSRLNDVEIIEFSALLLNTKSGLVEAIFHEYVRPVHFPDLSDYCKHLTGLTQSFIDNQKSFIDVYNKFIQWIREQIMKFNLIFATPNNTFAPNGLNATFCSWQDWDLGHFLYRDCIRNGIDRYECLRAWIDIRRSYDQIKLQQRHHRRITFEEALMHTGIVYNPHNQSGLENVNNLAKLVAELCAQGVQFKLATSCSY